MQSAVGSNPTQGSSSFFPIVGAVLGVVDLFALPLACSHVDICMYVYMHQVHRDSEGGGGGLDEALVEVTGDESARKTAQELIDDIVSSQDFRGI